MTDFTKGAASVPVAPAAPTQNVDQSRFGTPAVIVVVPVPQSSHATPFTGQQ